MLDLVVIILVRTVVELRETVNDLLREENVVEGRTADTIEIDRRERIVDRCTHQCRCCNGV